MWWYRKPKGEMQRLGPDTSMLGDSETLIVCGKVGGLVGERVLVVYLMIWLGVGLGSQVGMWVSPSGNNWVGHGRDVTFRLHTE